MFVYICIFGQKKDIKLKKDAWEHSGGKDVFLRVDFTFLNLLSMALCPYSCNTHFVAIMHSVFTALHGIKTRFSDEKVVRLSVCSPSVRLSNV